MKILKRVSDPSPSRIWYNDWVEKNAKGIVLDVGKSKYWDYEFSTIDINPKLNPTFCDDICNSRLPNNAFDTILCNGMYEFVSNPLKMMDEVYRILRSGGITIFGFVGKGYKPYKKDWKFYEDMDFGNFKVIEKKNFDNNYHFIICRKFS